MTPYKIILDKFLIAIAKHPFVFVPLVFYFLTCSPTIGLGDTALLIDGMQRLTINSHVNNHNITVIFGWLFSCLPLESIAYKGNLLSAFFGTLTVICYYFLINSIFRSRLVAAISAGFLMISHSLWWHSTIVECYAPNALFTVLAILLLFRFRTTGGHRHLYYLFFLAGLALFNHVQMGILSLGATGVLLWELGSLWRRNEKKEALRLFFFSSLCFAIGILPYAVTFLKDVYYAGSVQAVFFQASGGNFKSIMFRGGVISGLVDLGFLIFMQYPSLYLPLIPVGFFFFWKKWRFSSATLGLLIMFAVNTGFFMFYNTWDKFAFLLPSFVILSFFGAFAVARLVGFVRERNSIPIGASAIVLLIGTLLFPIYFYGQLSRWGRTPGFFHQRYNNNYTINTHDCAEFIANPNKSNYRDISEYARLLFDGLPPNAIFIDDDSRTYYPLHDYYQEYYGKRRDLNVQIINSWGFSGWGLNRQRFATLVNYAFENNKRLFLVSLDHPFRGFLEVAGKKRRFEFEQHYLSTNRWVYRLKTVDETGKNTNRPAPAIPAIRSLTTGLSYNTEYPQDRQTFQSNQQIMAALNFELNQNPFPVEFQWLNPEGRVSFNSKTFLVPAGNTRVWSFFDKQKALKPGKWTVVAKSENRVLKEKSFEILY